MQTLIVRGDLFWKLSNLIENIVEMRSAEDDMTYRAAIGPWNEGQNKAFAVENLDLPMGCAELFWHIAKRDRGQERFDQGDRGRSFEHHVGAFDLCRISRDLAKLSQEAGQAWPFDPDLSRQAVESVELAFVDLRPRMRICRERE